LGDPGLKKSIRVGEAALREAAAFLLDHGGFAKVPRTALVSDGWVTRRARWVTLRARWVTLRAR
jgi:hypothetical protein